MKLKTNSDQITKANSTIWGFLAVSMEQLSIRMMKRNDGPSAANSVVDVELVPAMSNLIALCGQLTGAVLSSTPSLEPRRLCKSMGNQVVAHRQLGPEVFNGVIADSQRLAIRNVDALQGDSEQLTFYVAPLSDGVPKLMFESNCFLGDVHGATIKPPNV